MGIRVEKLAAIQQSSTGFLKEFREFAMKGNVLDMAVGVIIGAAFGKIVSSLVADVIMPPLGLLVGGIDFSGMGITLREAVDKQPAVVLKYGLFLQTTFDFAIIALSVFVAVKAINRLKRKSEAAAPAPAGPTQEALLVEIRDLLKAAVPRR